MLRKSEEKQSWNMLCKNRRAASFTTFLITSLGKTRFWGTPFKKLSYHTVPFPEERTIQSDFSFFLSNKRCLSVPEIRAGETKLPLWLSYPTWISSWFRFRIQNTSIDTFPAWRRPPHATVALVQWGRRENRSAGFPSGGLQTGRSGVWKHDRGAWEVELGWLDWKSPGLG